ncbi:helix-turn-helix domain-containing protein [Sporolactobacillus terrae]|uniref:helix-turn-helix domain-containing protein n=1 Tax=Sporolactobacillus terrae TaxID=269673 RepID=UPI00056172D8|nr:helix-turn-helix transcriptional regulator [Sporolactobacillus terrae]
MEQAANIAVKSQFLRDYLEIKKISDSQLAELIGVANSTVNRILNGKRNPGSKFISGILMAFPDLKFEQLFYCIDELPKRNKRSN